MVQREARQFNPYGRADYFLCRAAVKSRNRDCLFSISFWDLTTQSLQLNPGLLHLKGGPSSSLSSSGV
jgi:hypothetical protein